MNDITGGGTTDSESDGINDQEESGASRLPGPWRSVLRSDGSSEWHREAVAGAARAGKHGKSRWEEEWDKVKDSDNPDRRWTPFADRREWEIGRFLASSGLSAAKIDEFLKTQYVRQHSGRKSLLDTYIWLGQRPTVFLQVRTRVECTC